MTLEVVILRQHLGSHKFLLECADIVEQVLRLSAADVVHSVGWNRQTIFSVLLFRSALHNSYNAFHNVIDIGEVPPHIAIVEDLYDLPCHQLLCGRIIEHVRTTCWTVNRKEPESRGRDIVELGIRMRQQLIRFLCCCIQADRIVDLILRGKRHLLVATVDGRAGSIDKMLHRIMTARLQQVIETDDVGFNIDIRVVDAVTHPRLCGKVHHDVKMIISEQLIHQFFITNGAFDKHMLDRGDFSSFLHKAQPVLLQCRIIVVVHIVKADHCAVRHLLQQPDHQIGSNESRRARHQDRFIIQINRLLHFTTPL